MASKQSVIELRIKAGESLNQLVKLKEQSRAFGTEITATRKLIKEFAAQGKDTKQLEEKILSLRKAQEKLNITIGETRKEITSQNKAFNSAKFPKDSIIGMEQEYAKLRKQIRELSAEERNSKFGEGLIRQSRNLKDKIRDVSTAFGDTSHNIGNYQEAIEKAMQGQGTLISNFQSLAKNIGPGLIIAGAFEAGKAIVNFGKEAAMAYDEQAKVDAQLKAGIISTNNAAGRSFEQLVKQANELQKVTLFTDDQIEESQSILLTFTKVKDVIFDEAIPAIADYSTKMSIDMKSATVQVGKALNDPIKGMASLSRAGVQFTEEQKEVIKQMVKTGDIAGAQRVILKELETQFGGSAKAAAEAGLGPFQLFSQRMGEIKESIGEVIVNGLQKLAPFLSGVAVFMEKLTDSLLHGKKATGDYGTAVNVVSGILQYAGGIISAWWNIMKLAVTTIYNFVKAAYDIPIIGKIIDGLLAPIKSFIGAISNSSAVIAGFKAGVQQVIENISNYFNKLVLSAEIMAKKVEKALTINPNSRKSLERDIKDLERQKSSYEKAGKTVGEAYAEAYNKEIKKIQETTKKGETSTSKSKATPTSKSVIDAATDKFIDGSIEDYKNRISKLEKSLESEVKDDKGIRKVLAEIVGYKNEIKKIENNIDSLRSKVELDFKVTDKLGSKDILSGLDKKAQGDRLSFEDRLQARIKERIEANANQQKSADADEMEDLRKKGKLKEFILASLANIASGISQIEQNVLENKTNKELDAAQKVYDDKIAKAQGNKTIEEAAAKELATKKAEIEKEAAKKRKEIAYKDAIIQGAIAAIAAWKEGTWAVVAAALSTAINLAVIASTQYAKGGFTGKAKGNVAPDSSGLRPVGVVHENEYVVNPQKTAKYQEMLKALDKNDEAGMHRAFYNSVKQSPTFNKLMNEPPPVLHQLMYKAELLNNNSGVEKGLESLNNAMVSKLSDVNFKLESVILALSEHERILERTGRLKK